MRGDSVPSVAGTVSRFALSGLVIMAGILLATTLISEDLGNEQAFAEARQIARLTGVALIEPMLDDGILEGDPMVLEALHDVVTRSVLAGSLVRVKVWTEGSRIVYSDEGRLIGSSFAPAPDRSEALETGVIVAEVTDLTAPENRFERAGEQLLEVYVPLTTTGGTPVLYEAYFQLDGVREAGRRTWLAFAPVTLGALALLQLVQIPLAWSLARRVQAAAVGHGELLQRALDASDVERRRIASDLHDSVVQDLTGVSYALSAAAAAPDQAVLEDSARQVRGSLRQLRSLLVDIYPPDLAKEGLAPALVDLLARLKAQGISTNLSVDEHTDLDPRTAALVHRIAQESLRNVIKHSGAQHVEVELSAVGGGVRLRIEDDGRGFDPASVGEGDGHLGMRILKDAAVGASGRLVVRSAPDEGTEIELWVPRG